MDEMAEVESNPGSDYENPNMHQAPTSKLQVKMEPMQDYCMSDDRSRS